jgi:putative transcriptional regulator
MRKKITKPCVEVGSLLVAEPFKTDEYFKKSVILIGEHNEEGTVGFILNKPTDLSLNDVLYDFPCFDGTVYFGGPVQTDTIHFLHTLGKKLEGSLEIAPGIYWGGNLDTLKTMISANQISNDDIRFYAGYSGWEPDAFKEEIKNRTWLVTKFIEDCPFSSEPDSLWDVMLATFGCSYATISSRLVDPTPNMN